MSHKLTAKHRAWLREFKISRNATEAARKAGYKGSQGTLRRIGHQVMNHPAVAAALREHESELEEKFELTADRVIDELIDMAFGNIGDVLDWDSDDVRMKPKDKMSRRGVKYIDSIKVDKELVRVKKRGRRRDDEEQEEKQVPVVTGIKVTTLGKEKVKALELLGKHTGLWKDGRSGADPDARRAVLERLQKYFQKNRRDGSGGGT